MTNDNWQSQHGGSGQMPPPQGQPVLPPPVQQGGQHYGAPPQMPLPPPEKRPTRNKRHGWLYVGLGVMFVLIGALGFVTADREPLFNWLFIVLGVVNAIMGFRAISASAKQIDPFGTDSRGTP